jgi:hypothetical protein
MTTSSRAEKSLERQAREERRRSAIATNPKELGYGK